jgi:hypothetical protein
VSKRDDIAELLMAQQGQGWDALPMSENVEDRRPSDPLQAYVVPPPMQFEGSYPVRGMEDIVEHIPRNHGMTYPGPYDPFGLQLEPDRMALDAMAQEPQPEQMVVGTGYPQEARFDDALRLMQVFEASPRESGHLGYLGVMPVGSQYRAGDPDNPYVRRKPGER